MALHGKTTLFVGDLSIFCSEAEIAQMFRPFGEIIEIKIMKSEETSQHLSYGFIKFGTIASAQSAMDSLNGVILCGRPMRIRWASYKNQMAQNGMGQQKESDTSPIHVNFTSYQVCW